MPQLIFNDIVVDLPPEARKVYEDVEFQFITKLQDETIIAANAAVAGGKCRQIANGALYSGIPTPGHGRRQYHNIHKAKLEALRDLIDELQGQPLLVAYEFIHDKEIIQDAFPEAQVIEGTKTDVIDAFNRGEIPIVLGHPASMGHGLNLQETCYRVCLYGLTWNLDHYTQLIHRIYRQGQKSSHVIIYRIIARDTLDEVVIQVLEMKDKTQAQLLSLLKSFKR